MISPVELKTLYSFASLLASLILIVAGSWRRYAFLTLCRHAPVTWQPPVPVAFEVVNALASRYVQTWCRGLRCLSKEPGQFGYCADCEPLAREAHNATVSPLTALFED